MPNLAGWSDNHPPTHEHVHLATYFEFCNAITFDSHLVDRGWKKRLVTTLAGKKTPPLQYAMLHKVLHRAILKLNQPHNCEKTFLFIFYL